MSGLALESKISQSVKAFHRNALLGFAALLESTELDQSDAQTFQTIVSEAISHYDVQPKGMAKHFGINVSTVGRWAEGRNAPHPMVRPLVIGWIRDHVNQQIQQLPDGENCKERMKDFERMIHDSVSRTTAAVG